MGFRFRKSINLPGGFRVNASKSGLSYSWGTKGYRVTKTTKGTTRRTVTAPGTGISYSEETSGTNGEGGQENRTGCGGCLIKIIVIPAAIIIILVLLLLIFKKPDQAETEPTPYVSFSSPQEITSAPKKEDSEIASEILSEYIEFETVDFQKIEMGYQMTVKIPGISDREIQETAPENWEETKALLISAISELRDEFNLPNRVFGISVVDSNGQLMVKVQNRNIIDDRYYVAQTPNTTGNPNTVNVTVWITKTGSAYHSTPNCSGMKDPKAVTLAYAQSKGLVACSKCH